MSSQIEYYNRFGREFKEQILSCPEPHLWTTDYAAKGRVYQEMKQRIAQQENLVEQYFTSQQPVLDVGCGFGRQAYALAQKGFSVTGTDTSQVFIEIVEELFRKHNLAGTFLCTDVTHDQTIPPFNQLLLLDVLEHIPPKSRKNFMQRIAALTNSKGRLIVSLPHVKKRVTSQLNNLLRKRVTQYFSFFRNKEEHPYPIPQYNEMIKLTQEHFSLLKKQTTALTDYYVLEKR
ncbi:MAG TPA: class I SAM-dependent methyltransferase [Flavisolibacter sp.]|nr:class I SAM-dependent methyltransferase [Flavisolibacter sp.]